jgi:DNA modification methylase
MVENTLYYGDNLKVLREHIKDESIDLIYLDPPFNSNRSYNVLFKDESGSSSESQITAFDDSWHWGVTAQVTYEELVTKGPGNVGSMIGSLYQFIGANQMMAYLVMMSARLVELYRVLKPTGSLYLHCDPTASHYLKILLDMIFGIDKFRNEVIWKRQSAHSGAKKWGDVHDTLLFYSKSNTYTWNSVFQEYENSYLESKYGHQDIKGNYRLDNLTGAGLTRGDSGKKWIDFDPSKLGRHWAIPQAFLLEKLGFENLSKLTSQEKLDYLYNSGYIYISNEGIEGKQGFPQFKRYLGSGIPIQSVITDIPPINSQAKERLGYPTQKPIDLLERIISASSNSGEVVLDPFSGCGTCISAAQKLNRKWIGIDITHLAIAMHKARLKDMYGLEPKKDYRVIGEPEDLQGAYQLSLDDRFQFEAWAISLVEARPMNRPTHTEPGKKDIHKGSDRGIDGIINFLDDRKGGVSKALVQVKSGKVNSGQIRDLKGVLDREQAQIGIFITLEPSSKEMNVEALTSGSYHSEIWNKDYPRIQIFTIEELLNGSEVKLPLTPTNATPFQKAERVEKQGPKQEGLDFQP